MRLPLFGSIGGPPKRGSDKQTPQEPVGKWLSASEDERSCFEGAGQQTAPLIETYQQALEKFAAGTSFNLYWREMPKIFGQVDTSLQWLASISGTLESVYAMLILIVAAEPCERRAASGPCLG